MTSGGRDEAEEVDGVEEAVLAFIVGTVSARRKIEGRRPNDDDCKIDRKIEDRRTE